MVVSLSSINVSLKSLNGQTGGSVSEADRLRILGLAARYSDMTNNVGEVVSGFEILNQYDPDLTNNLLSQTNLVKLTSSVPGFETQLSNLEVEEYQSELNALEGTSNAAGTAEEGDLYEVVTLNSTEALSSVLEEYTGSSLAEHQSVLKSVAIQGEVANSLVEGIEEFSSSTPIVINQVLSDIVSAVTSRIPTLNNRVIDDFVHNTDPEINNTIRRLAGGSITNINREAVLKLLVSDQINKASEYLFSISTLENVTLEQIVTDLSALELKIPNLVDDGTDSSTSYLILGSAVLGSYVDSVEEFEGEIQSCSRDLASLVIHGSSNVPSDISAYHYILMSDGRLLRGTNVDRNISYISAPSNVIHLLVIGETITGVQSVSQREVFRVLRRCVPGITVDSYSSILSANGIDASNVQLPPGNPANAAACVTGTGLTANVFGQENLVTYTTSSGVSYTVAKLYAERFKGLIDELENVYNYEIKAISSYRPGSIVKTTSGVSTGRLSWHSLGLAIDINPNENPHLQTYVTDLPDAPGGGKGSGAAMPALAAKYGLGWGGTWASSKDTMHFGAAVSEGGTYAGSKSDGIPG